MIERFTKTFLLVIIAAVTAACSSVLLLDSEETTQVEENLKLIVNGVVSDVTSNAPLEGMKITLQAYADNSPSLLPDASKTVFTDASGVYTIEATGFSGAVTCMVTAQSPADAVIKYEAISNKIVVNWSGSSFDASSNTAYINECNFQMRRATP